MMAAAPVVCRHADDTAAVCYTAVGQLSTRELPDHWGSGTRLTVVARGPLGPGSTWNSTTVPIVRAAKWSGEGSAV